MDSALEYHITIKELPVRERPRERLRDYGPNALSTPELLAIILRTGTARENALTLAQGLLADLKGLEGLANASFPELQNRHGIGEAKAAQILAALELGRRLMMTHPDERPRITSPADVRNLVLAEMAHLEQEQLWVILLNTKNQVLGVEKLYRGSLNASTIRIGELFKAAIRANCAAVILVHNHPSGDAAPSAEDIAVTRQAVQAGRIVDIAVLDHVIIGRDHFVSLKERGSGFEG